MVTSHQTASEADGDAVESEQPGIVIFYPVFPRYRRAILEEICGREPTLRVIGGIDPHAGLTPLTSSLFPPLEQVSTLKLAGLSWNPGVVRACLARNCRVAIVAPALRSLSTWAIVFARGLTRRKTYLWGQCGKPGARGIKRLLQEVLNRVATGILVYGESERHAATELGTPEGKISIVFNATGSRADMDTVLEPYPTLEQRKDKAIESQIMLVYMGRLINHKRLEVLLDVAASLSRVGWSAAVTFVGSGQAGGSLLELARQLEVSVKMHGEVHARSELRRLLNDASFIVSPREIGLLAIDALEHGVPVITPDNPSENGPEVEALTPGVNSLRVHPKDANDIVNAIVNWLEQAPLPSQDVFDSHRGDALDDWSAENVADSILRAVHESKE